MLLQTSDHDELDLSQLIRSDAIEEGDETCLSPQHSPRRWHSRPSSRASAPVVVTYDALRRAYAPDFPSWGLNASDTSSSGSTRESPTPSGFGTYEDLDDNILPYFEDEEDSHFAIGSQVEQPTHVTSTSNTPKLNNALELLESSGAQALEEGGHEGAVGGEQPAEDEENESQTQQEAVEVQQTLTTGETVQPTNGAEDEGAQEEAEEHEHGHTCQHADEQQPERRQSEQGSPKSEVELFDIRASSPAQGAPIAGPSRHRSRTPVVEVPQCASAAPAGSVYGQPYVASAPMPGLPPLGQYPTVHYYPVTVPTGYFQLVSVPSYAPQNPQTNTPYNFGQADPAMPFPFYYNPGPFYQGPQPGFNPGMYQQNQVINQGLASGSVNQYAAARGAETGSLDEIFPPSRDDDEPSFPKIHPIFMSYEQFRDMWPFRLCPWNGIDGIRCPHLVCPESWAAHVTKYHRPHIGAWRKDPGHVDVGCPWCDTHCQLANFARHVKCSHHLFGDYIPCPHPGCDASFDRKDLLHNHIVKEHDGQEKPANNKRRASDRNGGSRKKSRM